ncbi:hypothetical protein [Chromobacterium sp. ASV23]|uniref:hypothetical protein n=1 Tax=Chromobacterium sp. ASV23 TaxID=2795110 RepID=UPI0018EE3C2D|nr:hypothetical protein [Chromobacterium sp. ASV23]
MTPLNVLLSGDGYKYGAHALIRQGIDSAQFYFGVRQAQTPVVAIGMNMVADALRDPITHADIDRALELVEFDERPWRAIADLGHYPVRVHSIPEGAIVDPARPILTLDITENRFLWLAPLLEAIVYQAVWYPSTVATKLLDMRARLAAGGWSFLVPQYNRGSSSQEQAAKSALAYNLVFGASEHQAALLGHAYPGMPRFRIGGHVCEHMITLLNDEDKCAGLGSAVMCDTNDPDPEPFIRRNIRQLVKSRSPILIDGGDVEAEMLRAANLVYELAGGELIDGKIMLPIPIVQLDNMPYDRWRQMVANLAGSRFHPGCFVFADEKYTAHEITRDTYGFAFKVCAKEEGGQTVALAKQPGRAKGTLSGRFELPITLYDFGAVRLTPYGEIEARVRQSLTELPKGDS